MDTPLLSKYITHDNILKRLIDMRCVEAVARQRKHVVLSLSTKKVKIRENDNVLYKLFPPRRQWVHSGKRPRENKTQIDKNKRNLLMTYYKERAKDVHADWYNELENYIDAIIKRAFDGSFRFEKPKVCFIPKEIDNNEQKVRVRPICQFETLEERIIGSLYNKALTNLFDRYFYDNSFAFRASHGHKQLSHLRAVNKVIQFRKVHCEDIVWVAECDMKKFFDTIDHAVIIQLFIKLLWRSRCDKCITDGEFELLMKVMFSYVDCFAFYRDVLSSHQEAKPPVNNWNGVPQGYDIQVQWVKTEIEQLRPKGWPYPTENYVVDNLGIPQGGALSGLIANIVLNEVDVRLKKYYVDNPDFLYVRFCDDMIMMGTEPETVRQAFESYKQGIVELNLFAHDVEENTVLESKKDMSKFWKGKTRAPYKWGNGTSLDIMPWITFVGYDINWQGDTRIRKKTINKEIKKQAEKYYEVKKLLRRNAPRKRKKEILESVRKRMISMSVGRVSLWNYKHFENDFSWAAAFRSLNYNRWSKGQLRRLDRHRSLMLRKLEKYLDNLSYDGVKTPKSKKKQHTMIPYYGKPFSYFGQVFKRW